MTEQYTRSSNYGWDIPKRLLRLTLYADQSKTRVLNQLTEDMYVKFNTTESVTGALNECNIVIGGLPPNKMFDLATSTTQWVNPYIPHALVIQAGYYNRFGTIFDGAIISAQPNLDSANYTISLKCMSQFATQTQGRTYSFKGKVPVSDIGSKLAWDWGLGFVDALNDYSITVTDFSARDTNLSNILRQLMATLPIDMYVSNGRLYLKSRFWGVSGAVIRLNTNDIIGTPEPTETGVIINARMSSHYLTGMPISVKSLKYTQLESTKFFLTTVSHVGDTHGRDWYTRLTLVKEGLGYYNNGESTVI